MSSVTAQQIVATHKDAYLSSQNASFLSVALFALMIYEYLITLEEERKNFWKGPFSVAHGLFFFNRYFSLFTVSLSLLSYTVPSPSDDLYLLFHFFICHLQVLIRGLGYSCRHTIFASFYSSAIGLGVIQAILITRVWFLFPGNKTAYFMLLFSFAATFILTIVFMAMSLGRLVIIPTGFFHLPGVVSQSGCHAVRPPNFWTVYLPSLFLHTGLYLMTVYQSMTGTECAKKRDLRRLLIVDGSLFYFIVLASVMFVTLGAFLEDVPQINLAAVFTPFVVTTTSIATSRIMFGLRTYFLEVEDNLGWEVTTALTTKHQHQHEPKSSFSDSFRSTITPPLPRIYRVMSFGPNYQWSRNSFEEEKEREFDRKMATIFYDTL